MVFRTTVFFFTGSVYGLRLGFGFIMYAQYVTKNNLSYRVYLKYGTALSGSEPTVAAESDPEGREPQKGAR